MKQPDLRLEVTVTPQGVWLCFMFSMGHNILNIIVVW